LHSLIGKRSAKTIRTALEKLPSGTKAYDHAYKDAMDRIEGQIADQEELAKQVLSWIICAKRRLTTVELQLALAVEVGNAELDKDNISDLEDMISVCAGLVTIDKKSDIIRLVHYTAQEYFERTQAIWFPNANTDITNKCVTYLLFDDFGSGMCRTDKEFEARLRSNGLYDYAARNWGYHARLSTIQGKGLILDLFEDEAKLSAASQVLHSSMRYHKFAHNYSQAPPMIGLHLAAYFGLRDTVMTLIEKGHHPTVSSAFGMTPLMEAAGHGYKDVVELLLRSGAEPNSKATGKYLKGETALSLAAASGHEEISSLLIEYGAEIDSIVTSEICNGRSPLSLAAGNGQDKMIKLLLDNHAKLDSKSTSGRTPMSYAAGNGYFTTIKLLIDNGALPDSKDNHGRTPLSYAAGGERRLTKHLETQISLLLEKHTKLHSRTMKDDCRHSPIPYQSEMTREAVVQVLLATGDVDVDSKDNYGQTPLSFAAQNGHEAIVSLLLEKGADPAIRDSSGLTPLIHAARGGHRRVVDLLLEANNVSQDLTAACQQMRLLWAAENCSVADVELLLQKGLDADASDIDGRTPLSFAAENGCETVIKLLLGNTVNQDGKDQYDCSPLSHSIEIPYENVRKGHRADFQGLLRTNVNPDSNSSMRRTPLSYAASNGHHEIVALLLKTGKVNADSRDNCSRTPLWYAADRGREAVVKLLLETGKVDADCKDEEYGDTPLLAVVKNGHEAIVRLLLDIGKADANLRDKKGLSPLLIAVRNEEEPLIKILLAANGIDPDSKDEYGRTPLSYAVQSNNLAITKLLLAKSGVNPNSKDKIGRTPLFYITENSHNGLLQFLLAIRETNLDSKDYYASTALSVAVRKDTKIRWRSFSPLTVSTFFLRMLSIVLQFGGLEETAILAF
jgi:ankyrin repeat protein